MPETRTSAATPCPLKTYSPAEWAGDGIPPIDAPRFWTIEEAEPVMNDFEPVVTFKVKGESRAYPLAILTWQEVFNDVVGGERSP